MNFENISTTEKVMIGGIVGAIAVGIGLFVSQNQGKSAVTATMAAAMPAAVGALMTYLAGLR